MQPHSGLITASFRFNFVPPRLAILKIVTWSDRGRDDPKDAQDLVFIMDSYAVAGNFDRVYEVEGVIEAGDHDPDIAGVYLLGLDIRRVAIANTLDELKQIIERDFDRLLPPRWPLQIPPGRTRGL